MPMFVCICFTSIYYALVFNRFWNGFGYHVWWLFDTCSVCARNLLNLHTLLLLHGVCMFLHIRKQNMNSNYFHGCFHYLFWHWLLTSIGIEFIFILEALWHKVPCFWLVIFYDLGDRIFNRCSSKKDPNCWGGGFLFRHFLDPVRQEVFWEVPWAPFGYLSPPVGSLLVVFGFFSAPFWYQHPHPKLCRRHFDEYNSFAPPPFLLGLERNPRSASLD